MGCMSSKASVGSDDKKSLLVTLGLPEEVAAAAVATDSSKGYKASKTPTALFYTLKVNDDAKPEWKQHFATYTAEAKASKGHVNVSHSYNEATREVICIDVLAGRDAMSNHIGNCFPAYARLLGAGVVMNCVEINQCVGCTQKFFTKSFLGDDAAILARSSGEEPAPPRHRAGVASMAWRTTR